MDSWHLASGLISLVAAFAFSWAVLHPGINEGLVVKVGMILMIFSLLVTAWLTLTQSQDWTAYWRAAFWLRLGLLVTTLGMVARLLGWTRHPRRRLSDWISSDTKRQA